MKRFRYALALTLSATLALAACGAPSTSDPQSGKAGTSSDSPAIVASFYPLQFIAERVSGSSVDVLTQPGAEPHDLELTPKQIASISKADFVFYLSGFQAQVDAAVDGQKPKHSLDVAEVVKLVPAEHHMADHADDKHGEQSEDGHENDHSNKDDHDKEHDGHDHGLYDPHFWLNPELMIQATKAFTQELKQASPANADIYDENAAKLIDELTELSKEFTSGLSSCKINEFVTSHAAFGYLAEQYDLHQIGISGLSPDEQPSPARIAEVQKLAKEHDVTTIFYETLVSPAVAESIAGDLGLKTAILDPLEGVTPDSAGDNYIEIQKENLKALVEANQCQ